METAASPERVSFADVWEAWGQADEGKEDDTRPILRWVNCFVNAWFRVPLTSELLHDLRLIGGEPDGIWGAPSHGSFRVSKCALSETENAATEPPTWALTAIREPNDANGPPARLALIDGNKRAVRLWKRLQAGTSIPPGAVVYVGILDSLFHFAARAASSLWK
jgi:hypothetical protein